MSKFCRITRPLYSQAKKIIIFCEYVEEVLILNHSQLVQGKVDVNKTEVRII